MKGQTKRKRPGFLMALLPIVIMILLTCVGFIMNHIPAQPLMIFAAAAASLIAMAGGYQWSEIMESITCKISKALPAMMILVTVGMMIGTWMIGGTIPMMIYYGLKIINPSFLLITAFYVTAITSLCTGTSWGSAGTIGVALMGVAAGLNVNPAAVAGAVISGAYFGDKLSPLSDTTNLAPIAAGTNIYAHIRHLLWTTGGSFIVASIVYIIAGMGISAEGAATPEKVVVILGTLKDMFHFNPFLLLPIVLVLGGSILKKPTIPVMVLSSFLAMFNAVVFQGFTFNNACTAAVSGFHVSMIPSIDAAAVIPDVLKLLNRGGMSSMMGTVMMAFCAYAFAGAVGVNGSFEVVVETLTSRVKSTGGLILTTVLSCLTTVAVTCNGALSILLCGEMFKEEYIKRGLDTKNLSRTLEDSITVTETLIPWTLAGTYMATTLGVATLDYLPWAVLNYTGIIFAVILGYTGIGIAKLKTDTK